MARVEIAGKQYDIQRFTLIKALRVITLLNKIQKLVPDAGTELAEFVADYRGSHVEVLDRVQAKMRYGGQIPVVENGEPVMRDGELLTIPAPIETLTETDWEKAGNVFRRPEDPPMGAMVAAIFPTVAERAEEPLLRLLAVCLIDNDDFRRYVRDDNWQDKADEFVRDNLEMAYVEDVMEVGVKIGEVLEGQVLSKLTELRDPVGKLLGRLGIDLPSRSVTPSNGNADDSKFSGSASSPSDTTGPPTQSTPSTGMSPADSPDDGPPSEKEPSSTEPVSSPSA